MSLFLPVIQDVPPLDPALVQKCEQGECTRCGLCCMTLRVDVPSVRGDIESVLMTKQAGTVCPQLILDEEGQYACALHEEKMGGDPRLETCRKWTGSPNRLIQISVQTELAIQKPKSKETVEMILGLVRRGVLDIFDVEISEENIADMILHYVHLGFFPTDVLRELRARVHLRSLEYASPARYQQLDRSIWEAGETLYTEFQEFIGNNHSRSYELQDSITP